MYLTGQGPLISTLKKIRQPLRATRRSGLMEYVWYERTFPKALLFQVHPFTNTILQNDLAAKIGFLDTRFQFDPHELTENQNRQRERFMLGFADQHFGGIESLWQDFEMVSGVWGALTGEMWPVRKRNPISTAWREMADEQRCLLEEEFMGFLGIARQYPSRLTRRATILENLSWQLNHLFSMRVLEDTGLAQRVKSVTDELVRPRKCCVCGQAFRPIQFIPCELANLDVISDCCMTCWLDQPQPALIPNLIQSLIRICGYVPSSHGDFLARSIYYEKDSERVTMAARALVRLGGIAWASQLHGSWMRAVIESGAVGDQAWPTARGVRCVAADGHVCLSLVEREIDDWLHRNSVAHEKEPPYPYHSDLNPKGRMRADWRVGDTFIEYFGLMGDEVYDSQVARKQALARAHGLDLLPIVAEDLSHLDKLLGKLKNSSEYAERSAPPVQVKSG